MNRIFSIAASLDGWTGKKDFLFPSCMIAELVDRLDPSLLKESIVLNINFPNFPEANETALGLPKGVRVTHLGERLYKDFVIREDKDNTTFVTVAGDDPTFHDQPGSDLNAVSEGYVSITPIANEVFEGRILDRIRFLENESWRCFSPGLRPQK
jgi:5'-nucleotidase